MIAYVREQSKEYRAKSSDGAADIVTEPGAGSAQQRREQRRQVHGEERKDALKKSDERQPTQQGRVIARDTVSAEHHQKITHAHPYDCPTIPNYARDCSGEEVSQDGRDHYEIKRGVGQFVFL